MRVELLFVSIFAGFVCVAAATDQDSYLRKRRSLGAERHEELRQGKEKIQSQEDLHRANEDEQLEGLLRFLEGHSSMPPEKKPSTSKQPMWNHEKGDIRLDPEVVVGELSNGMRYQLRSNSVNKGRLEMRLHIDAGANMEKDDEQGLAHFLEHMAFRTTEHFNFSVQPIFQRLGLGSGSHVNAYTNFHETVYRLGLPNLSNETVTTAFTWFRDVGDGIRFQQEEIDVERGVVLSELQDQDSVKDRLWELTLDWLIPDHLRSERDIIGTKDSITNMSMQQFQDFYDTYYVPRRTVVTLVGDMSIDDMEALVLKYFDSWEDSGDRGYEPSYGNVSVGLGFRTKVFVDSEVAFDRLTLDGHRPYDSDSADTIQRRVERMMLSIGFDILERRLRYLTDDPDSPISWASTGVARWYASVEFPYITVQPKKGQWRKAISLLEQEFRRAKLYGFSEAEIEQQRLNRLNSLEQQVLARPTRSSNSLINSLVSSTNGDFVVATTQDNYDIAAYGLKNLTTNVVSQTFSNYWDTPDTNLYLTISDLNGTSAEDASMELAELYAASQMMEVEPPKAEVIVPFAYTDFGAPGSIVSDTLVEDLEIRQLVLSNNIRVNLKTTTFAAENIQILCRFGTGKLGQPKTASMTFLDDFTDFLIENGGLGKMSSTDINRGLAGKMVGLDMRTYNGAFHMSGNTNPDDLQFQLQLLAAHFLDPGLREEAVRAWRSRAPSYKQTLQHTLRSTFDFDTWGWLLGNDERFNEPILEELLTMEAWDAKSWLLPQLQHSYLEISIVGDFNQTQAIEYLLETFGALDEREDAPANILLSERAISLPKAPQTIEINYDTKVPNAATMAVWELPSLVEAKSSDDMVTTRKLLVLKDIFRDRMRSHLREVIGGTYSPRAWTTQSYDFDYGFFFAYSEGEPEEMTVLGSAIMDIAVNMTETIEGRITEDELARALAPLTTRLEDQVTNNAFWLNSVVKESQAKPIVMDWFREKKAAYESVTVEELNDLAKQYLTKDKALEISILPINQDA